MDQEIRNRLRNVVTQCRKLLEDSVSQELEGKYAIFAKKDQVIADPNAAMSHLSEEEKSARKDILDHFNHTKARGFKPKDALDRLIREIAFTHLNRLCAYKMMEAREVYIGGQKFREAVSRGVNSNGVKFYLAEHLEDERLFKTGHQDVAYRHFLDWLGGLLSEEIGVLFNPSDSSNRLYPRQHTLDAVLDLLNSGGTKTDEVALRQAWPDIWAQDETIGWVYQYFTPKELREQARKESDAPRDSYELAFRNQFFTPRYVVEFLTDNSLGRIWYEMRKGATALKDRCKFMACRSDESIPHRSKRDPRELHILDPACGSGHFLLYCFDLLLTVYEEAYSDDELGPSLQREYPTLDEFRRHLPRLILTHNLHGIDIDLRATQIAALALWLRCQRAYRDMGFKKERPKITRSNIVCAEPMPGELQMRREFVAQLEPRVLGQVVEVVFDKMQLAGEAGSLLKIEEEIRQTIAAAKQQWIKEIRHAVDEKGQALLFPEAVINCSAGESQRTSSFDLSDISDDQFFERAEDSVVNALRRYAEQAQAGERLRRRLFSEDSVHGFSFLDLCRDRYDVVLMNPPFGETTPVAGTYIGNHFKEHSNNLLCSFVLRAMELLSEGGIHGAIIDKTAWVKSSYGDFRERLLTSSTTLSIFADLGWEVLDGAQVETSAFILRHPADKDVLCYRAKDVDLRRAIEATSQSLYSDCVFVHARSGFLKIPNASLAYDLPKDLWNLFDNAERVEPSLGDARQGLGISDSWRWYRLRAEVPPALIGKENSYVTLANGGGFAPFYRDLDLLLYWRDDGKAIKRAEAAIYKSWSRTVKNVSYYFERGISFPKRTDDLNAHVLPEDCIFTVEGLGFFPNGSDEDRWWALGLLNSRFYSFVINRYCGQHKHVGYIKQLPYCTVSSRNDVISAAKRAYEIKCEWATHVSTSPLFLSPALLAVHTLPFAEEGALDREEASQHTRRIGLHQRVKLVEEALRTSTARLTVLQQQIDEGVFQAFELSRATEMLVLKETSRRERLTPLQGIWEAVEHVPSLWINDLIAYFVMVVTGRLDIRLREERWHATSASAAFQALPNRMPGALLNVNVQHADGIPEGYPIEMPSGSHSRKGEGGAVREGCKESCRTIRSSRRYRV